MKIVTTKKSRRGNSVLLSVGNKTEKVKFDSNLEAKVSDELGAELLKKYSDLSVVDSKKSNKALDESGEPEETGGDQTPLTSSDIDSLSMSECRELARTLELPEDEWTGFKGVSDVDDFQSYLKGKLGL